MAREMLINVAEREECRVAVVESGLLEELYMERSSLGSHVGNICKGKVVNVESSIQAVFVDFGMERNGFLHVSDLHPRYFPRADADCCEDMGRRKSLKDRPPIQDCLSKDMEVVVQVIKEGVNTKGPTLSTYLSLPGKFVVMMPWMRGCGVSHKIEDEQERARLREIINQVKLPGDIGFIIRTAGRDCSRRDIQNDLGYLRRLWRVVERRMKVSKGPAEVYQESDLVIRTLRDVFDSKISKITCDSEDVFRRIRDFLSQAYPRLSNRVVCYDGKVPLFHKYKIEDEIAKVQSREVKLRTGGSIVIEQTEALVAIDVNSGRYRKHEDAEQTAYRINKEAAVEIARQLRLRDLGGLIVCDFIDMRSEGHRRDVERTFREAVRVDRARAKILRISQFGIVEMTRQRMRPSLQSATYLACSHCGGTGFVKSHESLAIEIIRLLNLATSKSQIKHIELSVSPEVADYLQNRKRGAIAQLEQLADKSVVIHSDPSYTGHKHELICRNARGSVVRLSN